MNPPHPEQAFEALLDYYKPEPGAWIAHSNFYARHGLAYLTARACLLARPVEPEWTDEEIINQRTSAHLKHLTHTRIMLHVHLATGKLVYIRSVIAVIYPEVTAFSFQRGGGRLRRVSRTTLERLTPDPASRSQFIC